MYLLKPYDDALQEILDTGTERTNKRTGIKTLSVFGMCRRYRLDTEYFPILTRRKVWPKSVFAELLWFLSGSTSNKDLQKLGCNFWNPWVDHEWEKERGFAEDTFGPVYGFQLRSFGGIYGNGIGGVAGTNNTHVNEGDGATFDCYGYDSLYGKGGFDQLAWIVKRIKEDSSCRRTLWTLWNPQDISNQRLPPCHMLFQVLVDDERRMTGILYQRSGDFLVGCCANVQFYAALTTMLAQQTDCVSQDFVHMIGDAHVYENQLEFARKYLELPIIDSPKLKINKAVDIFSYKLEDFVLSDFNPGPTLKIPVAV